MVRRSLGIKHAGGYGVSLSFTENGLLLGLSSIIQLVPIYVLISLGIGPLNGILLEELRERAQLFSAFRASSASRAPDP